MERRGGPDFSVAKACGASAGPAEASLDRISPHRPRNILEVLFAEISEVRFDPAAHLIVGRTRNADAARLGDTLQTGSNIDAVAQNILAFDQHIAEIDAHAVEDALFLGNAGVAFHHLLLDGNGAFDCSDDRGKFQQHAVAGRLDQPPTMLLHDWGRSLAMFAHCPCRARLILAHQARIAHNIGG